jgi:4-alpha-glucanotransferase
MNTPSLDGGNWRWRFNENQLNGDLAAKLAHLAELSDRLPKPFAPPTNDTFFA